MTDKKKVTRKTHIAIVLDCSTSMHSIREETVEGFNEQIQAIHDSKDYKVGPSVGENDACLIPTDVEMETTVSLVTFSTKVDPPKIWCQHPDKIRKLTPDQYMTGGWTAMLDAVGYTVDRLQEREDASDPDTSFLVVIISDGDENKSKTETFETIGAKIKECNASDRWTFTYMGANQDLETVSRNMSIPVGNTMSWNNDSDGTLYANSVSTSAISGYMCARAAYGMSSTGAYFTPDDASPTVVDGDIGHYAIASDEDIANLTAKLDGNATHWSSISSSPEDPAKTNTK